MTLELKNRFSGDEFQKQLTEMKKNLLQMLISRKVILSKAKEKKYDLTKYLKMIIKDIIKKNNLKNEEELIKALRSQGISFEEFKKQRLDQLMQERFIQEKIGEKINVDASEIVNYYRKNSKIYTKPEKITLNCIFLNKDLYFSDEKRKSKMSKISIELSKKNPNFKKIAEEYSDLDTGANRYFLGTFTKGDLDSKLEKATEMLKSGQHSDWIKTDNGWYIIELEKRVPEYVEQLKKVKDKIKQFLSEKKRNIEIKNLVDALKKESYIKILKEYK